jgi:hypothetical protein
MNQEHARTRHLKQQWDDEDAKRDELEQQAKQLLLEEHANQIFAPIEDFLTRLNQVLRAVGGSVEVGAMWEHLGDGKLRRVAKVTSTESKQQLSIDLTVQEAIIFYNDTPYRFSRGIEALIFAITREVEQFLGPRRKHASVDNPSINPKLGRTEESEVGCTKVPVLEREMHHARRSSG